MHLYAFQRGPRITRHEKFIYPNPKLNCEKKGTYPMLENKIRTKEETIRYMAELKQWLAQEREKPAEEMSDFFSRRIDGYDDIHLGSWAQEYAHIADYFDTPPCSLLDIGCGTGLEFSSLYERFPDVEITGVDLSQDMLDKLRNKYSGKNIRLIQADYFQYPFEPEKYDAALSFETLHHFPYAKKQKIFEKLFRTLKQGGYYIECDYIACCPEEEEICLEQYEYKRRQNHVPDDAFIHIDIPLTAKHEIQLMKNAGFTDVCILYENGGTVIFRAKKP